MIQRIQTIYLLASIICLSIVSFGKNTIIYFFGTFQVHYELNLYGIFDQEKKPLESSLSLPLYFLSYALILLLIVAIFSFKNLKRQSILVRSSFFIYGILLLSIVLVFFLNDIKIDDIKATATINSGFYLLSIGLPLLFFANNGIKRDKKLIDSLNRLR